MSRTAALAQMRRASERVVLALGILLVSAAIPATAQTSFNPAITIGSFYTNNYTFVGEPGGDKASSGYSLGLALPLLTQTRNGSFSAMYSTNYESFSDVDLDNGRHFFNFALNNNKSRETKLRLHLRYNLTQDQGDRRSLAENQLFLSPRADREFADFGFNLGKRLGPHYRLRLLGRVSAWRYGQFDGLPEENPVPKGFRDREAYRVGFGISRVLSQGVRLGGAYGYRQFELSNAGDQDVHTASLTFSYQVARIFRLGVAAGYFNRKTTAVTGETASKSGLSLNLGLGKAWRLESVVIGVRLGHAPNVGGGAQVGTATVTRLGVYLRPGTSRGRRSWSWSLYANWARREPVNNIQADIEAVSAGGSIFFNLGRIAGISASTFWVDQISDATLNRGEFIRFNLGLVIRPFGATRMASP